MNETINVRECAIAFWLKLPSGKPPLEPFIKAVQAAFHSCPPQWKDENAIKRACDEALIWINHLRTVRVIRPSPPRRSLDAGAYAGKDQWMKQKRSAPAPSDSIREQCIARAAQLGLSSYAIAQKTDGAVSADMVRLFLTRENALSTTKLQHVLRVLGLKVS